MSSRVNEVNGENLQAPQSNILATPMGPLSGTTPVSWYQKGKTRIFRILLKQQTVSGSGVSWAICKAAPRSRQINTPAPHHSCFLHVFYRKMKNVSTTMTRSAAIAGCRRTARSSLFLEILSSCNICTNSVIVLKNRLMYIMNVNVLQK